MPANITEPSAVLLISCPDQPGIVAAVTEHIFQLQGNVLDLDQHVDREAGVFLMRVSWQSDQAGLTEQTFATGFKVIADRFRMSWTLHDPTQRAQMALLVTKESHCLFDLLARHQSGDWWADIALIMSNRDDLKNVADKFDIPFHVFPITAENKVAQEKAEVELLKAYQIDTVILARYMQILSPEFIRNFPTGSSTSTTPFYPPFPEPAPTMRPSPGA